jgi:DNA-binding NarL/FixJ family response regulator
MTEVIRVLIADDHAIVRNGIAALLATEKDIEVIGEAPTGKKLFMPRRHCSQM